MPFTKKFSELLAGHFAAKTPIVPPTDYFLALHTADCMETGDQDEVTDTSYARMPLQLDTSVGTEGENLHNSEVIVFPAAATDNGQVTHFSIWTEATAGESHFYGELDAPILYNTGVSPALSIAALKLTMADVPCSP